MGRKKNIRGKRRAEVQVKAPANPSFPNIPEEVVVEILLRLPLASLPRFTCVSKQWLSLVPDIIAKTTGKKMVLVQSILGSGALTFHSIDEKSHVKRVGKPQKKITSRNAPIFFGSCNGLLLINIGSDLFLWNPVAGYFKKVLSHKYLADEGSRAVSGLCYDSSTDEYKAVMALSDEFVDVGSLRSKNWRRVRFPYKVYTVKSGPAVNGQLHWYVSDQILYLDAHTNQFSKVPMPEHRNGSDGNMIFGLGVLDGCLSMVRCDSPSYSEADCVEVLAMKEYGMQKSWTKLFSLSNLALRSCDKLEPLCYTKDGEALMKESTSGSGQNVRIYNPIDSSYNEILVQTNCSRAKVIMYEESLVTPTDDYDWDEEEQKGKPAYEKYYGYGPYGPPLRLIRKRNGDKVFHRQQRFYYN